MSANFIISVKKKTNPMTTKCYVKIKSFNYRHIENISKQALLEIKEEDSMSVSITRLPTRIKKITLIKSPHVHKKSREQFEIRKYSRLFSLEGPHDLLINLIEKQFKSSRYSFYFSLEWQS